MEGLNSVQHFQQLCVNSVMGLWCYVCYCVACCGVVVLQGYSVVVLWCCGVVMLWCCSGVHCTLCAYLMSFYLLNKQSSKQTFNQSQFFKKDFLHTQKLSRILIFNIFTLHYINLEYSFMFNFCILYHINKTLLIWSIIYWKVNCHNPVQYRVEQS